MDCKLIIFTKPYNSLEAKTRLRNAGLTDKFVNQLHNKLLEHTLRVAESFNARSTSVCWHTVPNVGSSSDKHYANYYLPKNFEYSIQDGNDFNSRLQNCWDTNIQKDSCSTILIGSDCPGINLETLNHAHATLSSGKACIGPTPDNGFYLIALPNKSLEIDLKAIISEQNQIEAANKTIKIELEILPILRDIDQVEDIFECLF